MAQAIIVVKVVQAIAKASLVDSIRDGFVDFLAETAKGVGKKEISDRIARLRSDAKLRAQIQEATERAAERWAADYPDRGLVGAVAESTRFADLPSVQEAIRTMARQPFDPVAAETLQGRFGEVLPPGFEEARVERGVATLLGFLQEEFAGIPALQQAQAVAAAIRTARGTEQIAEHTEALARIERLLGQMLAGPTPTEETLRGYLSWVIDQHRYLDPRGAMQTVRQVQVRMNDVYVSLTAEAEPALSEIDRRLYREELEALLAREDLRAEEKEDLRENLLARYLQVEGSHPGGKRVDLTGLVREHAKVVILGDPGAGKTTLLRYLALGHAEALRRGEDEVDSLGPARLPLYLRIASYAEYGRGRMLADFVATNIRGEEDSEEGLAALIRERLAEGMCLVLLDGLDEIVELDRRAEIAGQIDGFVRAHERSGNRFVVTSRVAGYRTAALSGDMAHYRVCDMDGEQIRRFLEQWCHAVECFQTPDLSPEAIADKAQTEIDAILHAIETNPGVRRLAANPLLLRVLALIHRTGARLPQRRIELYRLAADTLIRDWELARGVPQAALVQEAEATRLLAELAAWMHEEKPAGIATRGEVRRCLAEVKGRLEGKEPDHPDVQVAVDDFLERIRQHTGLFVERAPRRYGFMHLTFEEYFAARWLVAKPRQAARRIRSKLHRPRWQEPILLAIGFYGMEFPDDVDDLVEEAILGEGLGGPSPYEPVLQRDLLFAVKCLGDQDMSADLRRRLVNGFVQVWLDPEQGGMYRPLWRQIEEVAEAVQGSAAGITLAECLLPALDDEAARVRASAAAALRNATTQPEVVSALLAALHDEAASVREGAAAALGNATTQPEVVSALLAALHDEAEHVCYRAADALRNATLTAEAVSALLAALHDEVESVRYFAAEILGRLASSSAVARERLVREAGSPDNRIREGAVFALGLCRVSESHTFLPMLLSAACDPNGLVRESAASALSSLSLATYPEAIVALLHNLRHPEEKARASAAIALGNATNQTEVVSALLTALHDEAESVRERAAAALRNATTQPEVVSALLAALHDEDASVRERAAAALRNATTQPEVVSALLAALHDEDASVREGAAAALRNATAQPEVLSALLAALHDEVESVRASAAEALGNAIAQPEVLSALLAALHDEVESVRASAARGLRKIAHRSGSALPQELPERLSAALDLVILDEAEVPWRRARDQLFDALLAVAPGPRVD